MPKVLARPAQSPPRWPASARPAATGGKLVRGPNRP